MSKATEAAIAKREVAKRPKPKTAEAKEKPAEAEADKA